TGKNTEQNITINPQKYTQYAQTIHTLHNQGHTLMVVCGGGKPARYFINQAKQLDATPKIQDQLGVKSTHINALLFMAALGPIADQTRIYQRATDLKHAPEDKVLVGGGYKPGSSTDYRAVIFAQHMQADLIINATDIDGVYTKNPKVHADAEKLPALTCTTLEEIIKQNTRQAPGEYGLFDLKAVRLAKKIDIPIIIIDGTDPNEILRAVEGTHNGSTIR
ncbi:MAG: UMP kinase, partial [Candidatus Bathyarchaeota archaeon]|nr:UMP kinase [Candidatus Bathyarchaeota archaeon]